MWTSPTLRLLALALVAMAPLRGADAVQQSMELSATRDLLGTDLSAAIAGLKTGLGVVPVALRQALLDAAAAKQLAVLSGNVPAANDLITAMNDYVADKRISDPVDQIVDLTTVQTPEGSAFAQQATAEATALSGARTTTMAALDTVRTTATVFISEVDSLLLRYQEVVAQVTSTYNAQLGANATSLTADALARANGAAEAVRNVAFDRARLAFFDAAVSLYSIASTGLANGQVSPTGPNTLTAIPALQAQAATARATGLAGLTAALTYAATSFPKTALIDEVHVGEIADLEQMYQQYLDAGTVLVNTQNAAAAGYEASISGQLLATTSAGFGLFQTTLDSVISTARSDLNAIMSGSLDVITPTGLTQYLQTSGAPGQREQVDAVVARARNGFMDAAKAWLSDTSLGYGTPVANALDAYINAKAATAIATIHTRYDGRVTATALDFTVRSLNDARATLMNQVTVLRGRLLEFYDGMVAQGIANASHPHPEIAAAYRQIRGQTDELITRAFIQGDDYLASLQVSGGGFERIPIPVTAIDAQPYDGLSFTDNSIGMINEGLSILDNDVYHILGAVNGLTGVSTGSKSLDSVLGAGTSAFNPMMAADVTFLSSASGLLTVALGLFSSQACVGSNL